jgi:hypothetical protein
MNHDLHFMINSIYFFIFLIHSILKSLFNEDMNKDKPINFQ